MRQPKQVITARLEGPVLAFIDHNADLNGESRSTILNHIVKQHMKSLGMKIEEASIKIEDPNPKKKGSGMNTDFMSRIK